MRPALVRPLTAACLVAGPALLLADNILHPKEYERDHEVQQLAEIAENYTRWQLAHFLGFLGIVVMAGAVVGLAYLVARAGSGLGFTGGALALAGLLGFASVIALDGFAWGILGEVSTVGDPATAQRALNDLQQSEWALPFYVLALVWIPGMLVLALGLVRTNLVPAWAGLGLGIGAVLVGTEGLIVSNAYYVIGAAVLLAAAAAVAVLIVRPGPATP